MNSLKRLKNLTFELNKGKSHPMRLQCHVTSPLGLLSQDRVCASLSYGKRSGHCNVCLETSKSLSCNTNGSDTLQLSATYCQNADLFTKRTLLQKNASKLAGHDIPLSCTLKPHAKRSSHLVPTRQLSSVAFGNPQLLKSSSLGSSVLPRRHFSLEGFYTSLAQSPPVQSAQGLLLDLHQYLPWWALIPVATLAVRSLVVLPLAVHQAQVVARLAAVNAEMTKLAPELNKEVELARRMTGWDKNQAKRVFKSQLKQLYRGAVERENCHPFKVVLLVFFQMPLWVCLSVALRNITAMAQAGYPSAVGMKCEGALWFSDLTVADPLLIPLMLLAVNLTLTEVHALRNVGKGGLLQKVMLNGSRILIFVVAAAATYNPSSVSYYWLCSSSFGLFQGLLLMSPRVRRSLHIPQLGHESPTPYRDIARNLRTKVARIKALASK